MLWWTSRHTYLYGQPQQNIVGYSKEGAMMLGDIEMYLEDKETLSTCSEATSLLKLCY